MLFAKRRRDNCRVGVGGVLSRAVQRCLIFKSPEACAKFNANEGLSDAEVLTFRICSPFHSLIKC